MTRTTTRTRTPTGTAPHTGSAPRAGAAPLDGAAPRTAAAGPPGLPPLPDMPDPRTVGCAEARAVSALLFARMRRAEEGTAEYSRLRNTLVELNLSLVKHAAQRFRNAREPLDDIIQVGTIGLIKAINRFDPDRGVEFASFAMPTIIGEIKRFFRDTSWSVRVPRRLQELRLDLAKTGDDLVQELDREPTVTDLAGALGITEEEVVEGQGASNGFTARSLDIAFDYAENGNQLTRALGGDDPQFERIELLEALKPLVGELSERDRLILSLRYVEELTQSEIGERVGVSQMQVSRLLSRILRTLRAGLLPEAPPLRRGVRRPQA
ncbi:SigB/SigF/SigG family RNA polymerase sigma factor [Streptomyces sp. NPDC101118]|uniref:SigB/SigF/SigG family RNA polymerase sigma factor n=1 Tax=Streptomyces sp. NPDC101118 TaxID=3366109 RepID=UPI003811A204